MWIDKLLRAYVTLVGLGIIKSGEAVVSTDFYCRAYTHTHTNTRMCAHTRALTHTHHSLLAAIENSSITLNTGLWGFSKVVLRR